jgi:hypothetical protein
MDVDDLWETSAMRWTPDVPEDDVDVVRSDDELSAAFAAWCQANGGVRIMRWQA